MRGRGVCQTKGGLPRGSASRGVCPGGSASRGVLSNPLPQVGQKLMAVIITKYRFPFRKLAVMYQVLLRCL